MYPNIQLSGNQLRQKQGGELNPDYETDLLEIAKLKLDTHPNVYLAYTEEGLMREEELSP